MICDDCAKDGDCGNLPDEEHTCKGYFPKISDIGAKPSTGNWFADGILDAMDEINNRNAIKDSGNRTQFDTGAARDMHEGKGRYDLIPWDAIHELAIHCENGAKKYGERNCEKGIPVHSLIDSAIRHLSCYLRGMKDEPHLRAAMWNVAFAIWMEKNRPEMQDIPGRMNGK